MKKKIVSSKEIAENNFSLSPSDYIMGIDLAVPKEYHAKDSEEQKAEAEKSFNNIEVYIPESVTVVFTLDPTGARIYVDVPYHEDIRICKSEAIIKLTNEQGINVDVMDYTWEVIVD